MASVALVMSLLVPQIGNWWYTLTLLAPGAWFYYLSRGTREEEVRALCEILTCVHMLGHLVLHPHTLLAPGAWFNYLSRGTREEEVSVLCEISLDVCTCWGTWWYSLTLVGPWRVVILPHQGHQGKGDACAGHAASRDVCMCSRLTLELFFAEQQPLICVRSATVVLHSFTLSYPSDEIFNLRVTAQKGD